MAEIEQTVIPSLEWWQLSLRRDVDATLIRYQPKYKMRPKGNIYNNNEGENTKIPKHNPIR